MNKAYEKIATATSGADEAECQKKNPLWAVSCTLVGTTIVTQEFWAEDGPMNFDYAACMAKKSAEECDKLWFEAAMCCECGLKAIAPPHYDVTDKANGIWTGPNGETWNMPEVFASTYCPVYPPSPPPAPPFAPTPLPFYCSIWGIECSGRNAANTSPNNIQSACF